MAKKDKLIGDFLELRIQGLSFDVIAETLNVSKQTLITWSKDKAFQVQYEEGRAFHLHTIVKRYQMGREAALTRYGKLIQKLDKELDKRDLSDVPTDRLLKMLEAAERNAEKLLPGAVEIGEKSWDFTEFFGEKENFTLNALD